MKIATDRQLWLFLRGMQEGVRYIPTVDFWEEYQVCRVRAGWGRTNAPRQEVFLVRRGSLISNQDAAVVVDLEHPPTNFDLALTLSGRAFAFATPSEIALALAFAGGRCAPAFVPDDRTRQDSDTLRAEDCLDSFRALPGPEFEGTPDGFYREGQTQQFYGEIYAPKPSVGEISVQPSEQVSPAPTVNLALYGLTDSQAAQILAILGDPK